MADLWFHGASNKDVFLRSDFDRFGGYRQVTRVLGNLKKESVLVRAGHGIYTKPGLTNDLETAVNKVKARLGKRVSRLVTLGETTVHLGKKAKQIHNVQAELDDFKLRIAKAVVQTFSMETIRQHSLTNLDRWNHNGSWCSADDEWRALMMNSSDEDVIAAMTGADENANRLRQSAPYIGLLDRPTVE